MANTKTKKKKASKTLVVRDESTGLKLAPDSKSFLIENEKDAEKALEWWAENQEVMDKLNRRLAPLVAAKEMLRTGLNNYQAENEIDEIQHSGWASLLIERTKNMWIFREEDIPQNLDVSELEEPIKPLLDILREKFPNVKQRSRILNKVTHRRVNPEGPDEVVKSGKLSAEDVQAAFLDYIETTYVQVKPLK